MSRIVYFQYTVQQNIYQHLKTENKQKDNDSFILRAASTLHSSPSNSPLSTAPSAPSTTTSTLSTPLLTPPSTPKTSSMRSMRDEFEVMEIVSPNRTILSDEDAAPVRQKTNIITLRQKHTNSLQKHRNSSQNKTKAKIRSRTNKKDRIQTNKMTDLNRNIDNNINNYMDIDINNNQLNDYNPNENVNNNQNTDINMTNSSQENVNFNILNSQNFKYNNSGSEQQQNLKQIDLQLTSTLSIQSDFKIEFEQWDILKTTVWTDFAKFLSENSKKSKKDSSAIWELFGVTKSYIQQKFIEILMGLKLLLFIQKGTSSKKCPAIGICGHHSDANVFEISKEYPFGGHNRADIVKDTSFPNKNHGHYICLFSDTDHHCNSKLTTAGCAQVIKGGETSMSISSIIAHYFGTKNKAIKKTPHCLPNDKSPKFLQILLTFI